MDTKVLFLLWGVVLVGCVLFSRKTLRLISRDTSTWRQLSIPFGCAFVSWVTALCLMRYHLFGTAFPRFTLEIKQYMAELLAIWIVAVLIYSSTYVMVKMQGHGDPDGTSFLHRCLKWGRALRNRHTMRRLQCSPV